MSARPSTSACALSLAVLLTACTHSGPAPLFGTLERDRLELTAESNDPLIALDVHEGQSVEAGAIVARQDPAALDATLRAAQARADESNARLLELERGARREDIAQARARLVAARASRDAEQREYDRAERLVADRLVARTDLDRRREARDRSVAAVEEAEAALLVLTRGTRAEQVEQARRAAEAAMAEVAQVRTRRDRLVLRAPRSATVEALPYRVGERPPAGGAVVVLLADDAPFARVYVPEPVRAALRPNAVVQVRIDGSERAWRARLKYVAAQAAYTPYYALNQRDRSRLSFLAEFTLDEPEARGLPSGVPVRVLLPGADDER